MCTPTSCGQSKQPETTMDAKMKEVLPYLLTQGEYLIPVVIAVTVTLITSIVLCCLCCGRSQKGKKVCLVGLSDAGKTLLFLRLTSGYYSRTQTSMKENTRMYTPSNKDCKPVEIVDVPGNERLRSRMFLRHKDSMRAVVWVIDSVNFPEELKSLAVLGFELFSDPVIQRKKTPVLIACNKQDLSLSLDGEQIMTQLEKEISQVMVSKAAQLASLDSSRDTTASIPGCSEGEFSFSSLKRNKVSTVLCSARGKGDEENCAADIKEVKQWIEQFC